MLLIWAARYKTGLLLKLTPTGVVFSDASLFYLQDDLLYESLTVYETLYYAAMLRLPQHMDHNAKTGRVDTVISALGLSSCKDTIIGKCQPYPGHTTIM